MHAYIHAHMEASQHAHTQAEALEMIFEELHDSMYPSHRKNVYCVRFHTFCLLLIKQDLNHSAYTP